MTTQALTFNGFPGKPKDQKFPIPGLKPDWRVGETRIITDDYVRERGWHLPASEVIEFVTDTFNRNLPKDAPALTKSTVSQEDTKKAEKATAAEGKGPVLNTQENARPITAAAFDAQHAKEKE